MFHSLQTIFNSLSAEQIGSDYLIILAVVLGFLTLTGNKPAPPKESSTPESMAPHSDSVASRTE